MIKYMAAQIKICYLGIRGNKIILSIQEMTQSLAALKTTRYLEEMVMIILKEEEELIAYLDKKVMVIL
jgi:hypothetical protein